MKKTLRILTLGIVTMIGVVALTIPANAQDDDEAKQKLVGECNKIYNERFLKERKERPTEAYKSSKEWLEKCVDVDADIQKYLKEWNIKYEWAVLQLDFETAFGKDDYPNIYKNGREILGKSSGEMAELIRLKAATGNESVGVTAKMGFAGYNAERKSNITSYRSDATNYSKQAIQMLESGKAPNEWKPFTGKEDALAWLYFGLGYMWREASPKDSAASFYKSSMYNTPIKSTTATYYYISNYYKSEYDRVVKALKDKCVGVPDNDECKALDQEQLAWIDRWADALARAVKLGGTKEPAAKDWTNTLSEIFKARYKIEEDKPREEAVNEYVNSVQTKPLPDPSTKPEPSPVREIKQDAATSEAKPDGGAAISSATTTDVAMGNGNGSMEPKSNGTTDKSTTATSAETSKKAPAKKAPAKGKGGKKRP